MRRHLDALPGRWQSDGEELMDIRRDVLSLPARGPHHRTRHADRLHNFDQCALARVVTCVCRRLLQMLLAGWRMLGPRLTCWLVV